MVLDFALLCYVWLMLPKLLILQTETHDVLVEIPFQLPHYYSSRLGIFHHHDFLFSLSRSKARSWMLAGTCQMEYSLRLRIVLGTLIFHTPSFSSANSRVSSDKTVSSPSACFQPGARVTFVGLENYAIGNWKSVECTRAVKWWSRLNLPSFVYSQYSHH